MNLQSILSENEQKECKKSASFVFILLLIQIILPIIYYLNHDANLITFVFIIGFIIIPGSITLKIDSKPGWGLLYSFTSTFFLIMNALDFSFKISSNKEYIWWQHDLYICIVILQMIGVIYLFKLIELKKKIMFAKIELENEGVNSSDDNYQNEIILNNEKKTSEEKEIKNKENENNNIKENDTIDNNQNILYFQPQQLYPQQMYPQQMYPQQMYQQQLNTQQLNSEQLYPQQFYSPNNSTKSDQNSFEMKNIDK